MGVFQWLADLFGGSGEGKEHPSPSDIIKQESISELVVNGIYRTDDPDPHKMHRVSVANLHIPFTEDPYVWLPSVADTGSMDPNQDYGHNNMLIAGYDSANHQIMLDWLATAWEDDIINAANIVVMRSDDGLYFLLHRLVEMGTDDQGRYWRTRGDNNKLIDPPVWRDRNLEWLVIATLY